MVVDSSALIAVLLNEPETIAFVEAIAEAPTRSVSTASYPETAIVLISRSGVAALPMLDRLLGDLSIGAVSFTPDQASLAAAAYRQYGRGSGHAAGLNFGDCFAYALAKLLDEPLLFKGNDFSRTDIVAAVCLP